MCYTPKEHNFKYNRVENNKRVFKCTKCGKESKANLNIALEIVYKRKKVA